MAEGTPDAAGVTGGPAAQRSVISRVLPNLAFCEVLHVRRRRETLKALSRFLVEAQ